jgi:hypothetical protein
MGRAEHNHSDRQKRIQYTIAFQCQGLVSLRRNLRSSELSFSASKRRCTSRSWDVTNSKIGLTRLYTIALYSGSIPGKHLEQTERFAQF